MFVTLRSGVTAKILNNIKCQELCKVPISSSISKLQVAGLTRAAYRKPEEVPDIPPFPYHNTEYNWWNSIMDTSKCRVHKHSKVIVVDGQLALGKHKLAKQLAEEFDFLYLPQPTFDDLYVSHWGFDFRSLDNQLPISTQSCDFEKFLNEPNGPNVCAMQFYMFFLRQNRYLEALRHILCTGQGIVTVRSPWSDPVFSKTMFENGYLSPQAYRAYQDSYEAAIQYYLKPHLVIYLDASVDIVQKNIKKRAISYEVNSKVLTEKYLTNLEDNYKNIYLNDIINHSHLLVYDWSQGGDVEIVVEDIENLNFDNLHKNDERLKDWEFGSLQHKAYIKNYTFYAYPILESMHLFRTDVPEMLIEGEDVAKWYTVLQEVPDFFYRQGYNIDRGENVLWNYKNSLFTDYVSDLIKRRKSQQKVKN